MLICIIESNEEKAFDYIKSMYNFCQDSKVELTIGEHDIKTKEELIRTIKKIELQGIDNVYVYNVSILNIDFEELCFKENIVNSGISICYTRVIEDI